MVTKRIIVAITGASGAIYGIKLLQALRHIGIEGHLVVSKAAKLTIACETKYTFDEVVGLASHYYNNNDIGAAIASGSFKTEGMVIMPCTAKTLGEIASCATHALIARAADVVLKERRRLILGLRESPLHLGHIRAMQAVTQMGAIIAPPSILFYNHPKSIDDAIELYLGRVLDLLGIDNSLVRRWAGSSVSSNESEHQK